MQVVFGIVSIKIFDFFSYRNVHPQMKTLSLLEETARACRFRQAHGMF